MITLIGDVHGKYKRYHEIIRQQDLHPYSVQLGDFGFDYNTLKNVDPNHHVFIGGNHDNYDKVSTTPNYLGDYGNVVNFNGISFFFYRGAWSIDQSYRTIGIDWWEQEQVSIEGFMKAREIYRQIKPDIVLTHDCPESIAHYLIPPNGRVFQQNTGWALQELFNIHQPRHWYFGHWHKSWAMKVNGTNFKCLNELEVDFVG